MKAVIVDHRYLYTGSPDLTHKSHANEELRLRLTGSSVGAGLEKIRSHQLDSNAWDGA